MILTLVTLAVLSFGLVITAEYVRGNLLRLSELEAMQKSSLSDASTLNQILFALTREYDLRAGQNSIGSTRDAQNVQPAQTSQLAELLFDESVWDERLLGQDMEAPDGSLITVLDGAGLIDLNSPNDSFILYIAEQLGSENPRIALESLRDFTDSDSFRRLDGAEQANYEDNVLVPNTPLRSAEEVCDVKGWVELQICQDAFLRSSILQASEGRMFQYRTAGSSARDIVLPERGQIAESQQVLRWIRMSETRGFFNLGLIGGPSGPRYRVLIRRPGEPTFTRTDIMVLPPNTTQPFVILAHVELPYAPDQK